MFQTGANRHIFRRKIAAEKKKPKKLKVLVDKYNVIATLAEKATIDLSSIERGDDMAFSVW